MKYTLEFKLNARGREERPHIIRDALPMGEKVSRKGHGWARMPSWKTPEGADHAEEESQTDPLGEGGARDPQGEERIPRGGERIPKKIGCLGDGEGGRASQGEKAEAVKQMMAAGGFRLPILLKVKCPQKVGQESQRKGCSSKEIPEDPARLANHLTGIWW